MYSDRIPISQNDNRVKKRPKDRNVKRCKAKLDSHSFFLHFSDSLLFNGTNQRARIIGEPEQGHGRGLSFSSGEERKEKEKKQDERGSSSSLLSRPFGCAW
jgi:hypothetical protein